MKTSRLAAALHILALFNLAAAQPIFDLLSRQATFLVAHQLQPPDILFLTLGLSWLLPAILIAAIALLNLALRTAGQLLHLALVCGLMALVALLTLKKIGGFPVGGAFPLDSAFPLGTAALILTAIGLTAYVRLAPFRMFLSLLAFSAIVIPLVFLMGPSVRGLVFPASSNTASSNTATTGKHDPGSTPIVMIVFDALALTSLMDADGEIAGKRFPAFMDLARQSHWFRNATTVNDQTQYALPAIATGRYPAKGRSPTHAHYPDSIFTLLGEHYEFRVVEKISQLCPPSLCQAPKAGGETFSQRMGLLASDLRIVYLHLILPRSLAASLPDIGSNWSRFAAPKTSRQEQKQDQRRPEEINHVRANFSEFLSSLGEGPLSTFYFLHVLAPHVPWVFNPSGTEYGRLHEGDLPDGLVDGVWGDDEWLILQARQRYLLQLGYVDKLLGEAMDRLRRLGLHDQALIVVTADHGASFRPNDSRRKISPTNFYEILPVPLFIKLPKQRQGVVHDENVELIDLMPTLAGVLGLRPKGKLKGQDVFDDSLEPRPRKVFLDVEQSRALPLDAVLETRFLTQHIAEHFGDDWESVFRLGPFKDLVGRREEDPRLRRRPTTDLADPGFKVNLDQAWLYENLDLQHAYLPTRIQGTLSPPAGREGPFHLAVTVNGEIQATTRTWRAEGDDGDRDVDVDFSAMVPEHSFRDGRNDVRIFVISETGDGPTLLATAATSAVTYRLDAAAKTIIASSGESFQIEPRTVQGAVWLGGVGLEGWAADLGKQEPADRILVFSHGQFASSAELHFLSPELAERFHNERLGACGFRAIVSATAARDSPTTGLQVFAVAGSVASEIPLTENSGR